MFTLAIAEPFAFQRRNSVLFFNYFISTPSLFTISESVLCLGTGKNLLRIDSFYIINRYCGFYLFTTKLICFVYLLFFATRSLIGNKKSSALKQKFTNQNLLALSTVPSARKKKEIKMASDNYTDAPVDRAEVD